MSYVNEVPADQQTNPVDDHEAERTLEFPDVGENVDPNSPKSQTTEASALDLIPSFDQLKERLVDASETEAKNYLVDLKRLYGRGYTYLRGEGYAYLSHVRDLVEVGRAASVERQKLIVSRWRGAPISPKEKFDFQKQILNLAYPLPSKAEAGATGRKNAQDRVQLIGRAIDGARYMSVLPGQLERSLNENGGIYGHAEVAIEHDRQKDVPSSAPLLEGLVDASAGIEGIGEASTGDASPLAMRSPYLIDAESEPQRTDGRRRKVTTRGGGAGRGKIRAQPAIKPGSIVVDVGVDFARSYSKLGCPTFCIFDPRQKPPTLEGHWRVPAVITDDEVLELAALICAELQKINAVAAEPALDPTADDSEADQ